MVIDRRAQGTRIGAGGLAGERDGAGVRGQPIGPGKQTLTMNLPPAVAAPPPAAAGATGIPAPVLHHMERFFGHDFSDVRVHPSSGQAAGTGALAHTQGNDIHFAPGQFQPDTTGGQELLGHELAHVVQQRQGRVQSTVQAKGLAINDDPALEREADALGTQAARSSGDEAAPAVSAGATPATAGVVQMNHELLAKIAVYLGVAVTWAGVAAALGVSTTVLVGGLALLGAAALLWDPATIVGTLRERFATDPLRYDRLQPGLDRNGGQYRVDQGGSTVRVQENGALFIEMTNEGVEQSYQPPGEPSTSTDEKLHVPATDQDIARRSNIVTAVCLQHGIRNWKVARREPLVAKQPGTQRIVQALQEAGLLQEDEVQEGRTAADYQILARREDRRAQLIAFVNQINHTSFHQDTPPGQLFFELQVAVESCAQGFFPSEQSGREITVYVLPDFKTPEAWSQFVTDLQVRFEGSGLPRLPLAVGDAPVIAGSVDIEGVLHGYFSYRNEANAPDGVLGTYGFPHWIGGNAGAANARGGPLVFDQARVLPHE